MSSPDYLPKSLSQIEENVISSRDSFRAPLTHQYISTNGVRLHVVQSGPQDGPAVLFLHGFPEFWWGWRSQIDYFVQAGYRVIVPDQRGYNLSDKPRGVRSYHLDTLAGDVIGLFDALGIEKGNIVGHDWGAMVTWWVVASFPQRFYRAVTLNVPHPNVFAQTVRSSPRQLMRSWYIAPFLVPGFAELFGRLTNWRLGQTLMQAYSAKPGTFSDLEMARYRAAWARPGAMGAMLNWYRALYCLRPVLKDPLIKVPMRLIWGAQDVALSREMAAPSIKKYCETGDLIFLERASHWVQHDEPERVNRLIGEWLSENDPRSSA